MSESFYGEMIESDVLLNKLIETGINKEQLLEESN